MVDQGIKTKRRNETVGDLGCMDGWRLRRIQNKTEKDTCDYHYGNEKVVFSWELNNVIAVLLHGFCHL